MCRSRWVSMSSLLILLSASPSAMAEEASTSRLSPEQGALLTAANTALARDPADLASADSAINEALEAGEPFDVLYLTLARVRQLQDRCDESQVLLRQMTGAASDARVDPEDLRRRKMMYIEQMPTLCSGIVTFQCVYPDTKITLLGQARECGVPVKLDPGAYQFRAERQESSRVFDVVVYGAKAIDFTVALEVDTARPLSPEVTSSTPNKNRAALITGLSAGVVTLALAGVWGASTVQQANALSAYESERRDSTVSDAELDTRVAEINALGRRERLSGWGTLVSAGLGAGITALVWATTRPKADTPELQVELSDDRAGIKARWRF